MQALGFHAGILERRRPATRLTPASAEARCDAGDAVTGWPPFSCGGIEGRSVARTSR